MTRRLGLFYSFCAVGGRAFGRISRMCYALARQLGSIDNQQAQVIASTHYDMVLAPGESYYADQYWRVIGPHLALLPRSGMALDLGCGQGRMALRLASCFHSGSVIACDLSQQAIMAAKRYAIRDSVTNVDFRVQTIADCLSTVREASVDAALMTEVTFFHPGWREDLREIVRRIRSGGIVAVSFRPQYFYALTLARDRIWENVGSVLSKRAGPILGSSTVFTWQTSNEIRELLANELKLELLELRGIGVCSGIPGDPHASACQPDALTAAERAHLMELELGLGQMIPDAGRYMLAVARRNS